MKYIAEESILPLMPAGDTDGPVVVAQLGQTLDGRIATVTGASKYINGKAALKHLHLLRAHVDAVLVGVGTVIADDPQLTVRHVEGRDPVRVVVDPSGRMPHDARCLHDGYGQIIHICRKDVVSPKGAIPVHLPITCQSSEQDCFAPADIIASLAALGLPRILLEGGAETLARFLDADAVDLLHILMAPMIIGSGKAGLQLRPIKALSEARRPQTKLHLFEDGDVLFTCDMRRNWER